MLNLFSNNLKIYNELVEKFKKENKVAVVAATGVGKTYIMMKYISDNLELNKDFKVMILTPSSSIRTEHLNNKDWDKEWNKNVDYLTFQKLAVNKEFLNSSYWAEKLSNIDLLVVDEAHRLGASEWSYCYNKILSYNSSNKNFKVLGMTATPIRYTDGGLNVVDKFFNGVSVGNVTLSDAIEMGLVNKPVLIQSVYDLSDEFEKYRERLKNALILNKYKQSLFSILNKAKLDFSSIDLHDILLKYIDMYKSSQDNLKFVVFCPTIDSVERMKKCVENWLTGVRGHVNCFEYHSLIQNQENELKVFKRKRKNSIDLIFCINKLNEGVHLDCLDGVILLRNTLSPIVYYQQIGRVISANKIKTTMIFDLVDNTDTIRYVENSEIGNLSKKNQTYFNNNGLIPTVEIKYTDNNEEDEVNYGLKASDVIFYDETKDIFQTLRTLEYKLDYNITWYQDLSDEGWLNNFKELLLFIKENKRLPRNKDNGIHYSWLVIQLDLMKKGKLEDWKQDKLNKLNLNADSLKSQILGRK